MSTDQYEQSLAQLHERASNASGRPSHDSDVGERIEELWAEIHAGLDVTKPENFGPFLTEVLSERVQGTDASNRSRRLCGCGNPMCNVLSGEMPARLKQPGGRFSSASITPQRAREFVRQHSRCHAVQAALKQWDEKRSRVRQNLIKIIQLGNRGSTDAAVVEEDQIPS